MGNDQNKPVLLTNQNCQNGDPLPASISNVLLILANGQCHHAYIDTAITGKDLKELIYSKISRTLTPKNMMLQLNEKRIKDQDVMAHILTLKDIIIQKKIPVDEVSNIMYVSQIEDEISLEKGVIRMPCGHFMGRQSIISLLECLASQKKWEICCPFDKCAKEWDYSFCKKLATLTKEQDQYFTSKFNQNWLQHFTKRCPGCGIGIVKEGGNNRMKCSNKECTFGYFCFLCFKKWRSFYQENCGNDECNFEKNYQLLDERKKILLNDSELNELVSVQIPCIRLCPGCRLPIEHISGCKHIKCFNCKTQFCFVCLSILKRQWSCGNFNQYCGHVAQVQTIASK